MKSIDTGSEKVQKICDTLRKDALEPAQKQANEIIANAETQAEEIVEKARREAQEVMHEAREEVRREKQVFDASVKLAAKQAIATLRQDIETHLLRTGIEAVVAEACSNSEMAAKILQALISGLEKEGISGDMTAFVGREVSPSEVTAVLTEEAKKALSGIREGVSFRKGVQLKVEEEQFTIDVSDAALKQLLADFVREDFREKLFQA